MLIKWIVLPGDDGGEAVRQIKGCRWLHLGVTKHH